MKRITLQDTIHLQEAIQNFKRAKNRVALTGAGISVESGIDDFRSPGGLWSKYPVEEYGTISVFLHNPEKAWQLFRVLGKGLVNKKPNGAHYVLADLERKGLLNGVVTQNIDNLHQDAGSGNVLEIHGNHKQLHCVGCGDVSIPEEELLESGALPRCRHCDRVLKPDVVLFGENVRCLGEIQSLLDRCDLIMVIGTSAQVYPAASLPAHVKFSGGLIYEFNLDETVLTSGEISHGVGSDYFFQGNASNMLGLLAESIGE